MAICKICNREMLTAAGCGVSFVIADGVRYKRIPVFFGRCGDCGAKNGQFHHGNCDVERCPKCGGQLISCDCDVEYGDMGGVS